MAATGDGLVLIDKPPGWTSHDVVARVRRLAGTRKVGHAGTLDPMATGVLVLGVNRATRLLTYLVGADKEYTATIRLGQSTSTDDAEGEITTSPGAREVAADALTEAIGQLTGQIDQVPSAVSAIKVDGRRAYDRVRAGQDVQLAPRAVHVEVFAVTAGPEPATAPGGTEVLDVQVRVVCSSGTYIRALARDLGEALGTGGHLTALRRTRVGGFGLDQAQELLGRTVDDPAAQLRLLSLTQAATQLFPVRHLTEAETRAVRYGQFIAARQGAGAGNAGAGNAGAQDAGPGDGPGPVAGVDPEGEVVALLREREGKVRPELVFRPA